MRNFRILLALSFIAAINVSQSLCQGSLPDTSMFLTEETYSSYEETDFHSITYENMLVAITYETVYLNDVNTVGVTRGFSANRAHGFVCSSYGDIVDDQSSSISIELNPIPDYTSTFVYKFQVDSMLGIVYYERTELKGMSRDDVVKVNDIKALTELETYPNPTEEFLHIKGIEGKFQYSIYDLEGRLVSKGSKNRNNLYIGYLNSGNYILHITTEQESYSAQIIKL